MKHRTLPQDYLGIKGWLSKSKTFVDKAIQQLATRLNTEFNQTSRGVQKVFFILIVIASLTVSTCILINSFVRTGGVGANVSYGLRLPVILQPTTDRNRTMKMETYISAEQHKLDSLFQHGLISKPLYDSFGIHLQSIMNNTK